MANPSSSERFDFLKVLWNPSGSQIIAYASQIWDDIRGKKQTVINTEVQEALGQKAPINHNHDDDYAAKNHDHDDDYAAKNHDHDNDYAAKSHNHDGVYQPAGSYAPGTHTHSISDVTNLQTTLTRIEKLAKVALVI